MRVAGILLLMLSLVMMVLLAVVCTAYAPLYEHRTHLRETYSDWLANYVEDADSLSTEELTAKIFRLKLESNQFANTSRQMMETVQMNIGWLGDNSPHQFLFLAVSFQEFDDAFGKGESLARQVLPGILAALALFAGGCILIVKSKRPRSTGQGDAAPAVERAGEASVSPLE